MSKQHNTFPNEQPEIQVPDDAPEIKQPADPKEPEVPKEDPQVIPDELPRENTPEEESPINPKVKFSK